VEIFPVAQKKWQHNLHSQGHKPRSPNDH